MILRQDYEKTGCNRRHALSLLMGNDPKLLNFIFGELGLAICPDDFAVIVAEGLDMDDEDQLLVQLALEIWWDRRVASIHEALRYLGKIRFDGLLMAMEFLSTAGGCACPNCCQRLPYRTPNWTPISQSF